MPPVKLLRSELQGLVRTYVSRYGKDVLAARRRQPWLFSMLRRVSSLAQGDRLGSSYAPCPVRTHVSSPYTLNYLYVIYISSSPVRELTPCVTRVGEVTLGVPSVTTLGGPGEASYTEAIQYIERSLVQLYVFIR